MTGILPVIYKSKAMTISKPVVLILAASVAALALLFWLIYGVESSASTADTLAFLPATNAFFNAISACALLTGIYYIRRNNQRAHGISMATAFGASVLFLIGYIVHHALHGDTKFLGTGWLRPTYFFILVSHILLSAIVLPMVLTTLFFAATKRWSAHRALARWTWPAWLYVSITGVLIFVFLRLLNQG
jgi:putative membrane protein